MEILFRNHTVKELKKGENKSRLLNNNKKISHGIRTHLRNKRKLFLLQIKILGAMFLLEIPRKVRSQKNKRKIAS